MRYDHTDASHGNNELDLFPEKFHMGVQSSLDIILPKKFAEESVVWLSDLSGLIQVLTSALLPSVALQKQHKHLKY